jgi:hypothetical protein
MEEQTEAQTEAQTQAGGLKDRVAKVKDDATRRVQGEVAASPVVSATRERAQAAGRAASNLLPATREDVQRVQASLDRIEAELVHLTARLEELKPAPRRSAARSVDEKPQS